jgi:uncharacterized protein (TIGR02246 family)
MTDENLTARSIEVVDRLDIFDLYARQSHAVDSGDGDSWAGTFTEDGVFTSPTYNLTARGRAELKEFAETSNGAALARGEQFRHVISSIALRPSGVDCIAAKTYLMITATSDAGARVDRTLVMLDELRKVDGEWLFSSRETHRDH